MKDVQGLPPRDALLVLEPGEPGESGATPAIRRLLLSASPDVPRLHLVHGRTPGHSGPVGPFFRRLVDELRGKRLHAVEQVAGDRIVRLAFRGDAAQDRRGLVLELTGRQANLVLLGPTDCILDRAVAPRSERAAARLALDAAWSAPGGGARAPEDQGASLAQALASGGSAPEAPSGADAARAPLSWLVESRLGAAARDHHEEETRRRLLARVERKVRRASSLLAGLEKKLDAVEAAERVRQDGELLKAAMHTLHRGQASVELDDYFSEGTPRRTLELDPRRTPAENVERVFERYRKLVRSGEHVAGEIARARARLADLQRLEEDARDPDREPAEVDREAVRRGLLDPLQEADERKRATPAPRKPYRVFIGSRGGEIRVGRSARDNDALTVRHTRGNDLWLHTAEAPGSHVVLRLERGQEPDPEEVLDAAHLAIHFSPLRGADRAAVHVARKKFVHKPRGAKAGLVTLSGGRILQVRVQPGRMERLLRSDDR